jgi:hypothetical protein
VFQDRVAAAPGSYIVPDPGVVAMLRQYRASGRKTFLVTNSLWDYTNVVMNFLVRATRRQGVGHSEKQLMLRSQCWCQNGVREAHALAVGV